MRRIAAALLAGVLAPALLQQPLEHAHTAGFTTRYRVRLVVRTELDGQRPEKIGVNAYVTPFSRRAEAQLGWLVTRRVVAVDADGTAEIQETLGEFSEPLGSSQAQNSAEQEARKLLDSLLQTLWQWREPAERTLRYRQTRFGQLLEVRPEGVPPLGEQAPPLLTLWLLRALRPAAHLPSRPVRFGERWQEPRAIELPGWSDVRGTESGEWLEARELSEPAARLHVVQQLVGRPAGAEAAGDGTTEARFHGESLAAVSLANGRLLAARRAATREIIRTLPPVAGLAEPPRFRSRLCVEVELDECNGSPCLAPDSFAGGRFR